MSKKETSHFSGKPLGLECHDCGSNQQSNEGKSPMGTITVGVDLAKQVFSVCAVDGMGRVRQRSNKTVYGNAVWQRLQQLNDLAINTATQANKNNSKRLNAQGKGIMHLDLTGSSLWNR